MPTSNQTEGDVMTFSEWWKGKYKFSFGTRWLEPLVIPFAASAWDAASEMERKRRKQSATPQQQEG